MAESMSAVYRRELSLADLPEAAGAGRAWAVLGLILAACAVPLVVSLELQDTRHTMETIALMSSQETWLRQHGWQDIEADPQAWLMPTRNGEPRIVKPPMLVWLHMLAWWDLSPGTSTIEQLTQRARLVAAGLGLVLVGATYWAGLTLGGLRLATTAGLAAGSMWFVQYQSRTASYDIHMAAWASVAVAAGVWAAGLGAARPGSIRRLAGWSVYSLALTLALLSKGPLALVVTLLPMLAAWWLATDRRRTVEVGLVLGTVIATALWAAWYAQAFVAASQVTATLAREYIAPRPEFQTPLYYLALIGLVMPWGMWMVAGLFEPFVRAEGARRWRLLWPWLWFVLIFVFFSIPPAKQKRYILPITPAAALLAAQVFCDHAMLARRGMPDAGGRVLAWLHWIGLLAVSAALPWLWALQPWLVERGWIDEAVTSSLSWPVAAGVGALLVGTAAGGAWLHAKRDRAVAGAVATAVWMVVFSTTFWWTYTRGPDQRHAIRDDAELLTATVGPAPLRYFTRTPDAEGINEELLFFARRIAPEIDEAALILLREAAVGPVFVITHTDPAYFDTMLARGYEHVRRFDADRGVQMDLWRASPLSSGPP